MLQAWSVQAAEDNLAEELYALKKKKKSLQNNSEPREYSKRESQVSGPDLSIQAGMCVT